MANKNAGTGGIKCYYRQTKKLEPAMRKLPPTEENVSTGDLKSWNQRNQMLLPANQKGWRGLELMRRCCDGGAHAGADAVTGEATYSDRRIFLLQPTRIGATMPNCSVRDGWVEVEDGTGSEQRRAALRGVGGERPAAAPSPESCTRVWSCVLTGWGFFSCVRDELRG